LDRYLPAYVARPAPRASETHRDGPLSRAARGL
jgi:hypothetical protein